MELTKTHKWRLGIAVVATGLLITFLLQNMQVIEVNVLFVTMQIRRSLMILLTFGIGVLVGWVLRSMRQ